MKRITLLLTALIFVTLSVTAQDFIYMRNLSDRIAATHVNVDYTATTYNAFGDESGQVLSIENDQISMIAFENGDVRFFEREKKIAKRRNFKKNLINYHLFDLVVNNFKISYERILSNGKIGIQIPVAIGYGGEDRISGYDDVHNTFYTGLSLNFYPTGQGTIRYFMGPGIQVGTGFFEDYYYSNNNESYTHTDTFIFRFLINNGIMFTPIEALSISLVGSLGIRYTDKTDQYENSNVKTVGAFSANLSYRF